MSDLVQDYSYKLKAFTGLNADQEVSLNKIAKWVQLDVETPVAFTGGTVTLYYKTFGMTTYKPLVDSNGVALTISLSSPKIMIAQDFAISALKLVVTGADVGKTFNASVVVRYDNAITFEG